ncbi:lysophospholipid acyltransferase family protein [Polaribacter uvawellassae]|uniref:lysophospholipid acyltransferase family protein n=1 Tax=Polaribacter uvawellassae TaxID=3133495 RepID=UPI0032196EE8
MKEIWYNFFKIYIKTGLFFYTKKIKIVGKENIPKKGAVLFAVNHPNGLLDPLLVTTNTPRVTHYLVRAAVFKKPLVKKFLGTLNLMPIYRIRDGVKELSKNTEVFNDCYEILNKQRALMIFPEGSHDKRRTVRNLSKGFTRILFGAFDKYPELKVTVIPVGITYQNIGQFPCKVAIHYGKPILANEYYNPNEINKSINSIKEEISNQLKELSVHIPADENYETILNKLNTNNVDFTDVNTVNNSTKSGKTTKRKNSFNFVKPLYFLIILNSIFPWIIWKILSKKIDETEFVDTFRFGLGISIFPIFHFIQALAIYTFFSLEIAGIYFILILALQLLYSKLATTPTE